MNRWADGREGKCLRAFRGTVSLQDGAITVVQKKSKQLKPTNNLTSTRPRKLEGTLGDMKRLCYVFLLSEGGLPGVSLHFNLSIIMQELCEELFFLPRNQKHWNHRILIDSVTFEYLQSFCLSGRWWKAVKKEVIFWLSWHTALWFAKKKMTWPYCSFDQTFLYFLHRTMNSNPILFNMSRHLSVQAVSTVYLDQDGCYVVQICISKPSHWIFERVPKFK